MEFVEPLDFVVEGSNCIFSPFNTSGGKSYKKSLGKMIHFAKTAKNLQKNTNKEKLTKNVCSLFFSKNLQKTSGRNNLQKIMRDFHPKHVNSKPRCDFDNRICQILNSIYGVTRWTIHLSSCECGGCGR